MLAIRMVAGASPATTVMRALEIITPTGLAREWIRGLRLDPSCETRQALKSPY